MKIFLAFLFIFGKGNAQKWENDYKKMIDSAITVTCQKAIKSTEQLNRKVLYLIDENSLSYTYTGIFSGPGFKGINVLDSKNKSIIKAGIHAWKVIPILKGSQLKITIIDFFITYKSNNYNYANGGGAEIIFEYSCEENKWILIKSEYRGL